MKKRIKTILAVVICCFLLFSVAACGSSSSDATEETYGITADWEYYSLTVNGETTYRSAVIPDSDNPHFSSEDGATFKLNVVPDKIYTGDLTLNEDGTYTLTKKDADDSAASLNLKIEGDMLTITFPGGQTIAFKAK